MTNTTSSNKGRPPIVAIIGSTRFKKEHLGHAQQLTLLGKLVLLSGFWHHTDPYPISAEQKAMIDKLLLARIDAADEVLVVCPNGYIGESTRRGIEHAAKIGKLVMFTEPPVAFEPVRA